MASGGKKNWPNEPAAVPAPKASGRHSGGRSLPKAPSTRLNDAAREAEADQHAGAEMQQPGRRRIGHDGEPERVEDRAGADHAHRAEAVGDGAGEGLADAPEQVLQRDARGAKTSRPQPYSVVIGIWNSPAVARGPAVMSAMAQPAATTSSGEIRRDAAPAMASFQTRERCGR